MKASFFQKCSLALALAVAPFLAGCDQDRAGAATANDTDTPIQLAQAQPDATPPSAEATPATDDSTSTNADDALANAEGKLMSTPETAGTNVSTNPHLTDFVKLVQAGVGETVLLAYVTNSPSAFNVSSDDILYLNDLGTPESVISAMLQKDQQYGAGGVTAPPTTPDTAAATAPTPTPEELSAGQAPTYDANAMVQTPPLTPSADVEADVEQAPNASYSYFYDSLAPYGNWVDIAGYGPCWQPTVVVANPGWTPYCDRGHWAYTDCGWCWVSDYSWGWAPFHYGRWFHNSHYGWCWAPDTVWGPAWVSWRYSDAFCGWAPLPPSACFRPGFGFTFNGRSVGFGFSFGLAASRFTFVSLDHFHDRNPGRFRVQHREVTKIYNTTIINNQIIRGSNNRLINRGIPVDRVARATHQDIRPIRIRDDASGGPRATQLGRDGRSLSVYRPALPTPHTSVAPRRVGEGVKPAPNFDVRSRVERTQARSQAERNPTARNQEPRNPVVNNTPGSRPIIGNPNANRPDNVAHDNRDNNRGSQPAAERPGSLIMRGSDRQNNSGRDRNVPQTPPNAPGRNQQFQPAVPNQPDRGDNNNRRVVTPPFTPNQNRNDSGRQNQRDFNQPEANRSVERQQQQQQMQQQRQVQQDQMQQQRQAQQEQRQQMMQQQQQQRILQQQQRDVQQPQRRQEAPARSFEVPRAESPRMQESRPAPSQQYSAPAPRQDFNGGGGGGRGNGGGDGGGLRGGGGGGGGRDNNNGNGGGGRGR